MRVSIPEARSQLYSGSMLLAVSINKHGIEDRISTLDEEF